MKNYITWLKAATIFQLINAVIHAITLFVTPPANNDTEKQLYALLNTYKFDLGGGFHKTMSELMLPLSASFCLLCLLGGLLNWYLLKKKTDPEIMKGVITINLIVFGISFVLIAIFTFLLPVVLMGLVVLFLILSRFTVPKKIR